MKKINPKKYKFNFGKYKGSRFLDVLKKDAQYIIWCHQHVKWFKLRKLDLMAVRLKAKEQTPKRIYPPSGAGGDAEHAMMIYGDHSYYGI